MSAEVSTTEATTDEFLNITPSEDATYETLLEHDDYEIQTTYPYRIRNKNNHKLISEFMRNTYISVWLDGKHYDKHRLIALQFIHNDDENKTQVDHINHNRVDNHIENLRWVSVSENNRNKSSNNGVQYEFVNEIPDDAIVVDEYNTHQFEFYYYSESTDNFYYFNGHQYRKLHINERKSNGSLYVNMMNKSNKRVKIYFNKFKQLYDIPF